MSYRVSYFGSQELSSSAFRLTDGSRSRTSPTKTIGGFVDADSATAQLELPYVLTYSCLVYESAGITALGATLDKYRAMVGKREKLIIVPWSAMLSSRWAWARCIRVNIPATVYNRSTQQVDCEFLVESSWRGMAHGGSVASGTYLFGNGLYSSGAGTTLNTSPKTITVNNGGNTYCDDCGITVTAGSANITYLKVVVSGYSEWEFVGAVTAEQSLIIDCGARFVRANGVDAYESFQLTSNHVIAPWLRLTPGDNSVVVTLTGGSTNSSILFTYSDAWA